MRLPSHSAAALLLAAALALRLPAMWTLPFWVDEAESSINALAILEHGVPTDTFLGAPIFENMLVRPWPEHPELEFRDISYSDRGVTVYHGWLPLYAIAAAFRVGGIAAPPPAADWRLSPDVATMRFETVTARLPSLLFSMAFVVLTGLAAGRMAGRDAALAALVLTGLSSSLVVVGSYARYHAATLALSALAANALWRVSSRGSARDHTWLAVAVVLLFHTHLIAFATVVAVAVVGLLIPPVRLTRAARLFLTLAVAGLACLPWFVLSGFAEHLQVVSQGPRLLDFSIDVRDYVADRIPYAVAFGVGGAWLLVVSALHGSRTLERLKAPFDRHGQQYMLLVAWMAVATALWFLLTPPASAWPDRLSLCLFVPGTLWLSLLLADACRTLTTRSVVVAPLAAVAFLAAGGLILPRPLDADAFARIARTLDAVDRLALPPDAKVYASPNAHLVFGFYARRPIQSIAPIRKPFLDTHPRDVVVIEQRLYSEFPAPDPADVARTAAREGVVLSSSQAAEWSARLSTRHVASLVSPLVRRVEPPVGPLPSFADVAFRDASAAMQHLLTTELTRLSALPIFRGFPIRNGTDVWTTFAYRLVDPAARSGARLNAHDRLACGTAMVVPATNYVIYHSPAPCA